MRIVRAFRRRAQALRAQLDAAREEDVSPTLNERQERLERLRERLHRYGELLQISEHSLSVSERDRAVDEMARMRGEIARMLGRDKAAIIKAVGGTPHVVTGYRNFGDAFTVVLSDPDHPMAGTALEAVLRSVEQAIGFYDDEESVAAPKGEMKLHPRLAKVSEKLIRDGHLPQAAFEASKALIALVQDRTNLTIGGLPLIERALSPNNPMLVFNGLTSEAEVDEHRGIFHLAQGVVLVVRHVGAHTSGRRESDERILELLGTMNYLTHRIEKAQRRPTT